MTTSEIKQFARQHAPTAVAMLWGRWYGALKTHRAHGALETARSRPTPSYLPIEELDRLMALGYRPPDTIRYDPDGLVQRATSKIDELARAVALETVRSSLELGAWDGMVAAALADKGIASYGLDITNRGFDARAKQAGVRMIVSDAGAIAMADRSIDLAYSFASLEHFPQPDRSIGEVARVLRPGGHAFLSFGPLYFSPYGLHAYRQIPVPFCHLLFREADLHSWAEARGLTHEWPYVNGWSLARYRGLFASIESVFDTLSYVEHETGGVGTELIEQYPACFTSHATTIQEFLVTQVEIVLRKR